MPLFVRKSRRARRNLKRFSKKGVDLGMFVKDLYVDNGLAYISCNVSGYYDIIDRYSVVGYEWLNESFARFVESNANYIPTEYPILLEICGHRFTKSQQACIEETIADYYALKMGDAQIELDKNFNKSAILFVFLLIFAGVLAFTKGGQGLSPLFEEALFVIFWFFLWEFLDCAWFDRRDLDEARVDAAQLASIKVSFSEQFEDGPVEPEEEKRILAEIFEDDVIVPSTEWHNEGEDNA